MKAWIVDEAGLIMPYELRSDWNPNDPPILVPTVSHGEERDFHRFGPYSKNGHRCWLYVLPNRDGDAIAQQNDFHPLPAGG